MKAYILGILALIGSSAISSVLYRVHRESYPPEQQPYSTLLSAPVEEDTLHLQMNFKSSVKKLKIGIVVDGDPHYHTTLISNLSKPANGYYNFYVNESVRLSRSVIGDTVKEVVLHTSEEIFPYSREDAVWKRLQMSAEATKRRLAAVNNPSSTSFDLLFVTIAPYVHISHILVLVGVLTNSFEVLIPVIEFCEMFYFLGFYNILKGTNLNTFYARLNTGIIDPYTYIKTIFGIKTQTAAGVPSPVLNVGLNQSILSNLMPDLAILAVITLFYVLTKLLTAAINNETLRKINYSFKSVWIGLFYVQSWRFCFFAGLQARFIDFGTTSGIIDTIIMALAFLFVVIYPMKLLFEIKAVVNDITNTDLLNSVGLLHNMELQKIFEFDCLNYSNLYFPLMNYFRHMIFFICLGVAFDITKVQIGGTIVAMLLYFTSLLNLPPMKSKQRNTTLLLSNTIIIFVICAYISADITETIYHNEVTQMISTICVICYLAGLGMHFLSILAFMISSIIEARKKPKPKKDICKEEVLELGETEYMKTEKKMERAKPIKKTKEENKNSNVISKVENRDSQQNDKISNASSDDDNEIEAEIVTKPKITKTRKGRII